MTYNCTTFFSSLTEAIPLKNCVIFVVLFLQNTLSTRLVRVWLTSRNTIFNGMPTDFGAVLMRYVNYHRPLSVFSSCKIDLSSVQ